MRSSFGIALAVFISLLVSIPLARGRTTASDLDENGVVNLGDWAAAVSCATGPLDLFGGSCPLGDYEFDGDVDLGDFAIFQARFHIDEVDPALTGALARCLTGPSALNQPSVCGFGDADLDADFDLRDAAVLQRQYGFGSLLVTYFGGGMDDFIRDVTIDSSGGVYLTGGTSSLDFPVTPGAYQSQLARGGTSTGTAGYTDAFIAKYEPNGRLIWSTYFGGPNYDRAYAIEVDPQGNVYIAGRAGAGFPVTPGVVQPQFAGDSNPNPPYGTQDGFIAKFSPDGILIWSTYFGGPDRSFIRDLDLDAGANVYVALGDVTQPNPHITPGALLTTRPGMNDGVVAKISPDGTTVVYGTYVGGSDNESGQPSLRVDDQGHAFSLFGTESTDAMTTPNAGQPNHGGGSDQLLWKLSPDGSTLEYGTYFGGSGSESTETHSLAIDQAGNAIVAVSTSSTNIQVTPGAYQTLHAGGFTPWGGDGVVAKFGPDGTLVAVTYLGGSDRDGIEGVSIDRTGRILISGTTQSANFPTTSNAYQPDHQGGEDMFGAILSPDLTTLVYGTYIGGGGRDQGRCSAVDESENFVVGGITESMNLPVENAVQATLQGGEEGALVRLHPLAP